MPHTNEFTSNCNACTLGKSHRLSFSSTTSVYFAPLDLVITDLWALLLVFNLVFSIISHLSLLNQDIIGYIFSKTKLMPCLHFSPSKNMSSYNYRLKLNSFKEMGVVNFEALIQVFKNLALGIATHVLMLLNKMVWWKVIIDKQ